MFRAAGGTPDDPFFAKGLSPQQRGDLARSSTRSPRIRSAPPRCERFEQDKVNVKRLWTPASASAWHRFGGASERYFIQGSTSTARWTCWCRPA